MKPRTPPHVLDGTSKLGNFLVGTLAGAICIAPWIWFASGRLRYGIYSLALGPVIGILCVLAATDPNVKATIAEQNRRIKAGEKGLSFDEQLEGIEAGNPDAHKRISRFSLFAQLGRLFR